MPLEGLVQSAAIERMLEVRIRPCCQKDFADVWAIKPNRELQGSCPHVVGVRAIDIGTAFEQPLHNLNVPIPSSHEQRRSAVIQRVRQIRVTIQHLENSVGVVPLNRGEESLNRRSARWRLSQTAGNTRN